MLKSRSLLMTAVIVWISLLAVTGAPADDRGEDKTVQAAELGSLTLLNDYAIAAWLIADCEVLVSVEEMAIDRCRNAKVRQFAQQMLTDHRKLIGRLHQKGMGVDVGERAESDEPVDITHRPKEVTKTQTRIGLVELKQGIGESLSTGLKRELKAEDVQSFDVAYLSYAALGHVQLLSTMNVLQSHASPSLAEEIDLSCAEARKHLDRAKELLRQVD
jgi:predicted outer membrane protein